MLKFPLTTILLIWISTFGSIISQSQSSDIYLIDVELENDTFYLNEVLFLNQFNLTGYNGGIEFIGKDKVLLSTNRNTKNDKTKEIVFLNVQSREMEVLTNNGKADDLPSAIDYSSYSYIQTDNKGNNQVIVGRLNSSNEERAFSKLDNIQHIEWINDDSAIFSVKSDLNYMAVGYKSDESFRILEANVANNFKVIDDQSFYYIHKFKANNWYLKKYELDYLKKKTIAQMPADVDFFDLFDDGSIVCAKGSKIFRYKLDGSKSWQKILDLSHLGINKISDLKVNGSKILIVNKK